MASNNFNEVTGSTFEEFQKQHGDKLVVKVLESNIASLTDDLGHLGIEYVGRSGYDQMGIRDFTGGRSDFLIVLRVLPNFDSNK